MRLADNAEESGVDAWTRMVAHYDQRQGTDVTTEMPRLIWTNESFGKAATLEEAKTRINEYEQEVARFEQKRKNHIIDEELKEVAIRRMMPEEITKKFNGGKVAVQDLFNNIIRYVDDSRTAI